mgnify:CR=1 FL=1
MTLWLSLLALALGAMGFVLYPLRRRALDDGDALRLSSNLATFEERRAELAEDLADGRLDAASHRALLAELDRALLADVGTATPTGVKMAARPARRVLWASAVLMPLLALLFYAPWGLSFGAAEDLAFKAELEVFDAAQAALGEDPTASEIAGLRLRLEGLERRLRSLDAKEPDGWFLVGQRAMDLGAFAQAATAFEEVEKLTGGALVALVYRAQALYLANDRRLDPTARALVDRVLATVPDQPVMLELLAMDAFSQARYREAAETFRRVLAAGVTNPARRQFLEDAQRRAAELGGLDLAALGEAAGIEAVQRIGAKAKGDAAGQATLRAEAAEALIGAIYQGWGGLEPVHRWLTPHWQRTSAAVLADPHKGNAKSALQEWSQARKLGLPSYSSRETSQRHGDPRRFHCQVSLKGEPLADGWGGSRWIHSAGRDHLLGRALRDLRHLFILSELHAQEL